MLDKILFFLRDFSKELNKHNDNCKIKRLSLTFSSYMYLLSLILVYAKAAYSFDESWFVCLLPAILILSINVLIIILIGLSTFLSNYDNIKLESYLDDSRHNDLLD